MLTNDPGECIICGAEFCSCVDGSELEVVQLPSRDRAASVSVGAAPVTVDAGPVVAPSRAEQIQATLPPGQFTSGTYRRKGRAQE